MSPLEWVVRIGVLYPADVFVAALRATFPGLSPTVEQELSRTRASEIARATPHLPVDNSVETVDGRIGL